MSDQADTQAASWRAPRRSGVLDPALVRMGWAAAAIAGLAAVGFGGYAMLGHRTRLVPVIEADSQPVRVRPENPGGAMVDGAEEQVMGGNGHGQADAMAPAAEIPAPQALRAQIEAARQPAAERVSLAAPPPAPAAQVSDMPEAPPPRPAQRPPTAAATGTQVQLGALESEQAAMTEWQRLSRRMPDLLGARHPAVLRAQHEGRTVWRLRTGGFSDVASANAFCAQVRAKGLGCSVGSF